jgi:O-antigen/teichoic acid export membrane protein
MKATSIFGGVQVFNIAIAIVRSKAIALFLGPAGMGLAGLLTSTTSLISSLTNFGLGTSAVRDVAEAHAENNEERMGKTIAVFRKLVLLTGGLGAILCLIFSPWLSQLTFGNRNYTWSFVFLSFSLFFSQLTAGQNVLLQGTRKLKYLAFANMLGSITSLVVSLPLYYFYGEGGVVPAIMIMSIVTFVVAANFSRKLAIKRISVSFSETWFKGKAMLKLGFILSMNGVVSVFVSYVIQIYIANQGNLADVGLYNAGFQIIGTYVGLIFSAMATDYYPRLTAVASDNKNRNTLVNQQGEIAILILFPIILIFMVFIPYITQLLYSSKFTPIQDMIIWAAFSMLFKAGSWAIAFQFLAKGSNKLYVINELITYIYLLVFNVIGYYYFGLTGLGYSYLATYIIYTLQVYVLTSKNYCFSLNTSFAKIFLLAFLVCGLCMIIVINASNFYKYVFGSILIIGSSMFSIHQINHRTRILTKTKSVANNIES